MKAIGIRSHGGIDRLEVMDLPRPVPAPDEVLVEVHASSLNPVDFKIRNGSFKLVKRYAFPLVLGCDLSGVVVETGADVRDFKPGDCVFGRVDRDRLGAFAEYARVRAAYLAHKPARASHAEAASLPLVALTAWQGLVDRAKLRRGQRVLIHAGAGGIGTIAIQIARHLGAKVIATSSAQNHALLRRLGADRVIDYRSEQIRDSVDDCDLVLDTLGGRALDDSFAVVRPGGLILSLTGLPQPESVRDLGVGAGWGLLLWALNLKLRWRAYRAGVRREFYFMRPDGRQLATIAELYDAGVIEPVVDRKFSLERARDAFEYLERGHARGKVLLEVRA